MCIKTLTKQDLNTVSLGLLNLFRNRLTKMLKKDKNVKLFFSVFFTLIHNISFFY